MPRNKWPPSQIDNAKTLKTRPSTLNLKTDSRKSILSLHELVTTPETGKEPERMKLGYEDGQEIISIIPDRGFRDPQNTALYTKFEDR